MINSMQREARNLLVVLFVTAACLIVVLRSLSPLAVNSDASVQIGAALALLNGDGMGIYVLNPDVSQPPDLNPLTWFAPAFSLVVFGLLKTGMSLAIALKLIYAIATIVGWLGWGLIFQDVVRSQQQTAFSKGVAILLAIGLPLYFTYDWFGTDLILWAGIPFIIRLFYLSNTPEQRDWSLWVGCLIGLMYTFRYASIFLMVGFFLYFLIKRKDLIKFGKIILGFSFFYGAVTVYRTLANTKIPGHLSLSGAFQTETVFRKLLQVVDAFRQVRFLLLSHLSNFVPNGRFFALIVLAVLLIYASILIWGYPRSKEKKGENTRLELILCLNYGLILFLASISFFSSTNFVFLGDQRYYYPLFPSLLLVAYEVGFQPFQLRMDHNGILKLTSLLFLGSLVFLTAFTFLRAPDRVFGFDRFDAKTYIKSYPSNAILNRHPESYQAVLNLLQRNPQAIAISFAEDFDFSHLQDINIRKRFLPVSPFDDQILSSHTSSKNLQAYLIFGADPNCKTYCYFDSRKEVALLKKVSTSKVVYDNQTERIKILSVTLPQGLQFQFSLQ